jgi:CMP/dCMP kinase
MALGRSQGEKEEDMDFRVVCISRTLGAGGEVIGKAVAEGLGFRYVDQEIVTQAAEKARVDPEWMAEAERRQPILRRILDALSSPAALAGSIDYVSAMPIELAHYDLHSGVEPTHEDFRAVIREVIRETANRGDVVMVAHAASMALRGTNGVLRVLVTASAETRAQRLSGTGQQLKGRDAAAMVRDSDRERRDYFRRFYNLNEELPTHYDLVVNTDVLEPEQAAKLIVSAVRG